MTKAAAAIKRGAAEGRRERDDFYRTPAWCTEALLRAEAERMPRAVWEPACGDGAIASVLRAEGVAVHATDLVDRGAGLARRDFLLEREWPERCGGIVTNPPYKLATDFAVHALEALRAPYMAMLLRLAFLEGAARHEALYRRWPPARLWVFSRRATLWRGDEEPTGGGSIAYAWFVWDAGQPGATRLGWC